MTIRGCSTTPPARSARPGPNAADPANPAPMSEATSHRGDQAPDVHEVIGGLVSSGAGCRRAGWPGRPDDRSRPRPRTSRPPDRRRWRARPAGCATDRVRASAHVRGQRQGRHPARHHHLERRGRQSVEEEQERKRVGGTTVGKRDPAPQVRLTGRLTPSEPEHRRVEPTVAPIHDRHDERRPLPVRGDAHADLRWAPRRRARASSTMVAAGQWAACPS